MPTPRHACWLLGALLLGACADSGALNPDPALLPDRGAPAHDAAAPDAAEPDAEIEVDARVVADAALDAEPDATTPDMAPPDPEVQWARRACATTVTYTAPPGTRAVQLAGAFTGWAERPLDMARAEGDRFTLTLTPDDGLEPGQLYGYKVITDGTWRIDPTARYRTYDGDCVNGGVRIDACDQPDVEVLALEPGTEARIRVLADAEGEPIDAVDFVLDGAEVEAELNAETGVFTVDLADLADGKHRLTVTVTDEGGDRVGPIHLPFWVEDAPFDWRDTVLYLAFIDRFANGDRGNDRPVGPPVTYPAEWHGGDLQGALAVLESGYFERMGVKAIWLSPINAQVDGHWPDRGDGSRSYAAYHGYWPIRAREVEPRVGGNAALRAFIEAAHARGIRVLLDLINNQIHEDHEYFDAHPEWFRTACVCGADPGCGWSERPLDCLFARYLPDINWRHPGAEAQFIADALYWVEALDVDGFRVDAVKHVETTSVYNLRAALADTFERGGHRVVMLGETAVGEHDRFADGCGEAYDSGYAWISAYTGPTALDGQFDFPTHHRIQWGLLTGTAGFDQIESAVATYEARYDRDALHVQFLGSHDSSRMASRAALDPHRDCRWAGDDGCPQLASTPDDPATFARLRRAFTLLFTLPGMPLLYYGDEIALPGGNDPDSRRDMLWGGALGDLQMGAGQTHARQEALRDWVAALATARGAWPALTRGARRPLLVTPDLYVYARTHEGEAALVVLNRGAAVGEAAVDLGGLEGPFEVLVGEATARVDGGTLYLSIGAGESAILGGR